ncbi:hypothetical protein PRZ48_000822 [Zasmidium cellare]|uniref:Uncharacterized protein n=1 Tax=Zasmidium cellare TaxID=395010 RepID=A0ABR0F166_ZASCE|nr:hypothetical protein PRZ48_000822 [Zasmidium cellare]
MSYHTNDPDREPLLTPHRTTVVSKSLLHTIARISSLTFETTTSRHVHRDNPIALDLLKRAVEVTRPWLEDVRAELEYYGHVPSTSNTRGVAAGRGYGSGDGGFRDRLMRELPSLVPIVAKYVAMSKDRKSDGKRLEFLGTLLGVLEGKVAMAEREIGRLERLLARGEGGRRRERVSERRRNSISEGEESEWYREREERRGGAREEYYRGEVGDGEGGDGRRRERRRRHRGGSRRRSDVEDERSSHREERREHRGRRESRITVNHDRQAQDEAQRNDPPPPGPAFNQMTPEERLKAKERTLAMHKERKAQEEAQKKTGPARKSTSSRKSASSGTTESIARFPPLPIGVHAPRGEEKANGVPG